MPPQQHQQPIQQGQQIVYQQQPPVQQQQHYPPQQQQYQQVVQQVHVPHYQEMPAAGTNLLHDASRIHDTQHVKEHLHEVILSCI